MWKWIWCLLNREIRLCSRTLHKSWGYSCLLDIRRRWALLAVEMLKCFELLLPLTAPVGELDTACVPMYTHPSLLVYSHISLHTFFIISTFTNRNTQTHIWTHVQANTLVLQNTHVLILLYTHTVMHQHACPHAPFHMHVCVHTHTHTWGHRWWSRLRPVALQIFRVCDKLVFILGQVT